MPWYNSRGFYSVIVGFGAAFGMAMGHQPPLWIAIAFVGGLILGWFTSPWKTKA